MAKPAAKDILDLLEGQTLPETTVPICLKGHLTAQIIDLDRQLAEISQEKSDTRLVGNPDALKLAEQIKAMKAEADAATILVRLRAVERKDWADLVAKHPGEKGQDYNAATIFNDAIPACIVEPELAPAAMEKFLSRLTQGQWDNLAEAVYILNVGEGKVPFSELASRVLRSSDETSKPLEPTG